MSTEDRFALFESAGVQPKVIFETDNMEMAVALAAAGVGIAIAPPTAGVNVDIVRVPLTDPAARRDVAVCWLAGLTPVEHVADFLDHVRSFTPPAGTGPRPTGRVASPHTGSGSHPSPPRR